MTLLKPIKIITNYALPITGASLLNIISNFIGMLMVAHLGEKALGASALAMPTYITVMTIVSTSLFAISILISHAKGRHATLQYQGDIVKNGLWLACFMSVPSAFALWHADKALALFGQPKSIIDITKPYFHYAALSIFPMLLSGVIAQFYTGIGQPRFGMITSLIRLPFIVLLSYGYILGHFGLPQIGLAGVMCATWIVQLVYTVFLFLYLYQAQSLAPYQFFQDLFKPSATLLKKIFLLGIPIGMQFGGELAAMTTATYLVGLFGVAVLASSQVVSQFSMFVVMVILGISQAISVLISHAFAEKDFLLVRHYISGAFLIYGFTFCFVVIAFLGVPHTLLSLYIDIHDPKNHQMVRLTTYFFEVGIVFLLFDGTRHILAGALRGLHDSSAPMRIGILCLWTVSLPLSYLVGFHFHKGPIGLRIAFISGFVVASGLLAKRLFKKLAHESLLQTAPDISNRPLSN